VRVLRGLVVAALLLVLAAVVSAIVIGRPPVSAAAQNEIPAPAIDTAAGGTGPVLILLHGAGMNAHMWDPVLPHLDPAFRAIAIDLPGHGARRAGAYTVETTRAAVAAAARFVAPAPVILVGDSLGGYSAMASAASLPQDQLRGLVLSGCSGNIEGVPAYLRFRRDQVIFRNLLAVVDKEAFAEKALTKYEIQEPYRQRIMAAGMNLGAVEVAVEALFGIDFRAVVATIPQPILFLNGSLDGNAVAQEPAFVAAAPHATSFRFEGVPHGISVRRPAEFAEQINRFAAGAFAGQQGAAPAPPSNSP